MLRENFEDTEKQKIRKHKSSINSLSEAILVKCIDNNLYTVKNYKHRWGYGESQLYIYIIIYKYIVNYIYIKLKT